MFHSIVARQLREHKSILSNRQTRFHLNIIRMMQTIQMKKEHETTTTTTYKQIYKYKTDINEKKLWRMQRKNNVENVDWMD